ncbi:MAG: DUF1800 domain-containing protein [Bacteroidetes bacterium]|nr:DUF1800 domain-containing protein [Bacteroidota bacterium]
MSENKFSGVATPEIITNSHPSSHGLQRGFTGLNPYTGVWTVTEALHLARRTLLGATVDDIKFFTAMSMSDAVDYLLQVPAAQPAPPLKTYSNSSTPNDLDINIPQGSTWVNINTTDGGVNSKRRQSLKNWWMGLLLNSDRNIREKMVLFWHNHFATETNVIGNGIWCYQNNLTIRTNALGNFKTFVKSITTDTGMLRYLNGYLNSKNAPDENYGRELQELFTVGKGIDGATQTYSEADVKAAARLLTGWTIDGNNNVAVFNPSRHDTADKVFSAFYKNKVIKGQTGANGGAMELNDLVNMICDADETALHICRKLYRWFVYYDINDATEANIIAPLAQVMRANNYDIVPVLSALFKSEHFFDPLNQGCLIKNPMDFIAGFSRGFSLEYPVATDIANNYNMWQYLQTVGLALQQNIGDPPAVAGWPAYYQLPQMHELWINSDTLPKRNQFCDILINSGYTRSGKKLIVNPFLFTQKLTNPADPNVLIKDAVQYLLALPLTVDSMTQIKKDILLGGQISDHYWSDAWAKYLNTPSDMANTEIVKSKLSSLYHYLTSLAEYQLS